ncbi:MAG: deaminated glutathione amidase [Solirubrobacteraceae bacterium]|jgi:predicted amidohydrolase|nr:deaminated glutathione amidase [Solirubrobacteraceae bacterium]
MGVIQSASELPVAAVQLNAGTEKQANIDRAGQLVAQAAAAGARLVVLPEKWNGFGSSKILRACAEGLDDGESVAAMRDWARDHGIHLVGGSITERSESGRLFNTSLVFDPRGELVATYRKIHLFDVEVGGHVYRESDVEDPGEEIATVDVEGWTVGLSVCYDLRFPELYRILTLRGANVLVVPAAFTMATGRDHWELLLRARAVENQCYVIAAGDWGEHPGGRRTYGRSMIVDPWGVVIAQASDGDGVVTGVIETARVEEVRASLPALANRRPLAYDWPEAVPTDR